MKRHFEINMTNKYDPFDKLARNWKRRMRKTWLRQLLEYLADVAVLDDIPKPIKHKRT